ncbi:hypothetical protein, partial [Brevundimonas sp.]|uniref:hypothetical protein n=1 Tax=Brevundimonas sp. TaxID=1871086 RepID=UPI00257A25D5
MRAIWAARWAVVSMVACERAEAGAGFSSASALLMSSMPLSSQTCSDQQLLCPEAPAPVFVLADADAFLNFECIDATHVAVLRFQSDHDFENPGNARIRISQVSCEGP